MRISEALLPEFDQEMATTRKVLDRCPEEKYAWKPHQKSFSMGSLATHVVNMVGWGVDTLSRESFDISPAGAPPYKEEPIQTRAELLKRFDTNAGKMRNALASTEDEQFMTNWSLLAAGQPLFTMPRVAVLRGMILNHLIHHRGQLSVYLRMNDVPVPAIYGPSADEEK
jgi:uncharacterized damage-inducible protein DinB